jgi:hypothetical protein
MEEFDDDETTPIDWQKKYFELKKNFDRLDRHNDVLYRVYHAARLYTKATNNPDYLRFMIDELFARVQEVETFENGLKNDS